MEVIESLKYTKTNLGIGPTNVRIRLAGCSDDCPITCHLTVEGFHIQDQQHEIKIRVDTGGFAPCEKKRKKRK